VDRCGRATFVERTFDAGASSTVRFSFPVAMEPGGPAACLSRP
jgi:hypothetical protein